MTDLLKALKMETGQVFVVTVAALAYFWQKGAPSDVLWMVTILGGTFILTEKIRSAWAGEKVE